MENQWLGLVYSALYGALNEWLCLHYPRAPIPRQQSRFSRKGNVTATAVAAAAAAGTAAAVSCRLIVSYVMYIYISSTIHLLPSQPPEKG